MIGRNPNTIHMKKLAIMAQSVLLRFFFPVRDMVKNTMVGLLLNHSAHIIAGVPTLLDSKID